MTNIASALKNEITRIAGKTVRQETQGLKKAVAPYRSEIAALKRRVNVLEQLVRRLTRVATKVAAVNAVAATDTGGETTHRFSAKGLSKHRQRLGLSAQACGVLIGASGLSVYKWESGKARPRAKNLEAIARLRTMGKKEAAAALERLAA